MIKYIDNFGWIDSDSMDEETTVLEFWRSSWLACSFSMTWSWLSIFSVVSAWSTLSFEFLQIHSSKQRKDRENTNLQLEYEIRYILYIPGSVHKRHPLFQVVEGSSTWTNSGFWILADVLPLLQIYLSSFCFLYADCNCDKYWYHRNNDYWINNSMNVIFMNIFKSSKKNLSFLWLFLLFLFSSFKQSFYHR